jgi:hypothetical protein
MAEIQFLEAVRSFLAGPAGLTPAPAAVGAAEPLTAGTDLPAVVLSLEQAQRDGGGEGRGEPVSGALPWRAVLDLADPVLPGDPPLVLLSADRRRLTLPHGGLVTRDGGPGPLAAADFEVTVAGVSRTLVPGPPGAGEVAVEPAVGQLTFGAPLPASGELVAEYILGRWERRTVHLKGTLRADVCAADAAAVGPLAAAVVEALESDAARAALPRLHRMDLTALGSIGAPEPDFAGCRRQSLRFAFRWEHQIDRPDSSGGILRRIEVHPGFGEPRREDREFVID